MSETLAQTVAPTLTPSEFLILLALAGEPAHGYRLMQIINDVFNTETRIGPGTLYRALQRLSASDLIVELDEDGGGDEDERRRSYALTEAGRNGARQELKRIEALARLARVQLGVR